MQFLALPYNDCLARSPYPKSDYSYSVPVCCSTPTLDIVSPTYPCAHTPTLHPPVLEFTLRIIPYLHLARTLTDWWHVRSPMPQYNTMRQGTWLLTCHHSVNLRTPALISRPLQTIILPLCLSHILQPPLTPNLTLHISPPPTSQFPCHLRVLLFQFPYPLFQLLHSHSRTIPNLLNNLHKSPQP